MEFRSSDERVEKLQCLLGQLSAATCRIALRGFLGQQSLLPPEAIKSAVVDLLAGAADADLARLVRVHEAIDADQALAAELLGRGDAAAESRARDAWIVVLVEEILGSTQTEFDQAVEVQDIIISGADAGDIDVQLEVPWWRDITNAKYSSEAVAAYLNHVINWTQSLRSRLS